MGLDMRKFEYKEYIFAKMGNHAPDLAKMSALGKEGWEAFSAFEADGSIYVFLKREE